MAGVTKISNPYPGMGSIILDPVTGKTAPVPNMPANAVNVNPDPMGPPIYKGKPDPTSQPAPVNINANGGVTSTGLNTATGSPSYNGLVSATSSGGSSGGGSAGTFAPDPLNPYGPLLTQSGYENEQTQQRQTAADALAASAADAAKRGDMSLAAQLQAEAEQRRLGYLSTIEGANPTVTRNTGGVAANEQAARDSAFARAKEQAANTAQASLTALGNVMANSGKMGSSLESTATTGILNGARGDINDFTRQQLITDLNRAADVSDANYQGNITQRGQNLAMVPSLMGLITASSGLY